MEDDEEEPKLRYQRLGPEVTKILEKDDARCLAVHDRLLALGTKLGVVYVIDFSGTVIRKLNSHTAAVNNICIDEGGEFFASCSDDGKVVITSLYSGDTSTFSYGKPVRAVALDPNFARKTERPFCCGGLAGFFKSKDTVIHSGEGTVYAVKWRGNLIAWANDMGVKVYDSTTEERIAYIDRPKNSPPAGKYPCILNWENDSTLIIGWSNWIKIGVIRERATRLVGMPAHEMVILSYIPLDIFVCGVCPFGVSDLAVMAYEEPSSPSEPAEPPELRIINRQAESSSGDQLPIRGYERLHASDYHLESLPNTLPTENLFYIVSPKDVVEGRPCDIDDHVAWLLDHQKFDEALKDARKNEALLKRHNIMQVGEQYLNFLISENQFEKCASQLGDILRSDKDRWEIWVHAFLKHDQMQALYPVVPVQNPTLNPTVYEEILDDLLAHNHAQFLETITKWPSKIYNTKTLMTVTEKVMEQRTKASKARSHAGDEVLSHALAKLYEIAEQYERALGEYLRIQKASEAFALIRSKRLFSSVSSKILSLLKLDLAAALELLVENVDDIKVDDVVQQLASERKFLCDYLDALFHKLPKDSILLRDHGKLQVELYAEFDNLYEPPRLRSFLMQSPYYPLQEALDICQKHNRYAEMVYVLGKMGNPTEALHMIVTRLKDVKQAIEFIQTQREKDLWDLLLKIVTEPEMISDLLEHIGGHIDPIRVVNSLPDGVPIPHLRDKLVRIIGDYHVQMTLQEGCNAVLKADCVGLFRTKYNSRRRPFKIIAQSTCASCEQFLLSSTPQDGAVVFSCQHEFHTECLNRTYAGSVPEFPYCTLCAASGAQKKPVPSAAKAPSTPPAEPDSISRPPPARVTEPLRRVMSSNEPPSVQLGRSAPQRQQMNPSNQTLPPPPARASQQRR